MVGKVLFFTALILILTACGSGTPAAPTPTLSLLIMDEVHFLDKSAVYTIPPGNGFILDSRSYTYRIPPTSSGPLVANYFQIIGDSQYYGTEWQSEERIHRITADQLKPLSGATAFNGFQTGQRFLVAVGNMTDGFFIPLWTATIEVR